MKRRRPNGDDFGKGATAAQKARTRKWVEAWRSILFLEKYVLHVEHVDKAHEDGDVVAAECSVNHGYHQIKITTFPAFWAEPKNDRDRQYCLLHELCHAITHKPKMLAYDAVNEKLVRGAEIREANESATDWIAAIVWRLSRR